MNDILVNVMNVNSHKKLVALTLIMLFIIPLSIHVDASAPNITTVFIKKERVNSFDNLRTWPDDHSYIKQSTNKTMYIQGVYGVVDGVKTTTCSKYLRSTTDCQIILIVQNERIISLLEEQNNLLRNLIKK